MSKSSFLFTLIFSFLFTTSTHAADFAFYKKTTNYNIETSIGIATGDTRAAFAVKIVNKENTSLTNTLKVYKTVGTTTTCSSDIVFTETHTAQPQATFEKNIPISTLTPNTTYCFDYSEWVGEHFTTDKGTELQGGTSPVVSDGSYHLLAPFPGLSVLIDQSQCGSAKPGEICSIGDLLNFIFKILIGVTAVILVFRLVYEGYTYMVTDVPFLKASSKGNFMTALGGLLLAMAAWLILNTINPKLVSNDISVEEVSVGVEEENITDVGPGITIGGTTVGIKKGSVAVCKGGIVNIPNDIPKTKNGTICKDLLDKLYLLKAKNTNWWITSTMSGSHLSSCHGRGNAKSGNCADIQMKNGPRQGYVDSNKINAGSTNPAWGDLCVALAEIGDINFANEASHVGNCQQIKKYKVYSTTTGPNLHINYIGN